MAAQEAIDAFVQGHESRASDSAPLWTQLASSIKAGESSLLQLVEALGVHLTSVEDKRRAQGMLLLSNVLREFQNFRLDRQPISVLCAFFADRLKDSACTIEVLDGINALNLYQSVTVAEAKQMVHSFFSNVSVDQQPQAFRRAVFNSLYIFLDKHLPAMQEIGRDVVYGFIQLIDGEKDPRNLKLALTIAGIIASKFAMEDLDQDFFDVTACYFPITFTPPPNDPFNISPEDLSQLLCQCLAANAAFAPLALPLILDKLQAQSTIAKRDTLILLKVAAPNYGARAFEPFIDALRSQLKTEIYNAPDVNLEQHALAALASVTQVLSTSTISSSGIKAPLLNVFLDPLIKECQTNLREPDTKSAKTSSRVLATLASASDASCSLVGTIALPELFQQYQLRQETNHRRSILEILHTIIVGARGVLLKNDDVTHPFTIYYQPLLQLAVENVSSTPGPTRVVALAILFELLDQERWANAYEQQVCAQHITQALLMDTDLQVRKQASVLICRLATTQPKTLQTEIFSTLFASLQSGMSTSQPIEQHEQTLTCLGQVARTHDHIWVDIVSGLLSMLSQHASDPMWISAITTTLGVACARGHSLTQPQQQAIHVVAFILLFVSSSKVGGNSVVINSAVAVVQDLVKQSNTNSQTKLCACVFATLFGGNFEPLRALSIPTFSLPVEQLQEKILAATISSIPKEAWPSQDVKPSSFASMLKEKIRTPTIDEESRGVLMQLFASVINKWLSDDNELEVLVSLLVQELTLSHLLGSSQSILLFFWMTKALVMRGHSMTSSLLQTALRLLSEISHQNQSMLVDGDDKHVGVENVIAGFGVLLADKGFGLVKDDFAVIKPLYKQRVFSQLRTGLVEGCRSASEDLKQFYLMALSSLLSNISQQLLLTELQEVLPMMLQSLLVDEPSLQQATLSAFVTLCSSAPAVLAEHVATLIPASLSLAHRAKTPSSRIASLQLLRALASFPYHFIHPYRQQVLVGLIQCLDDAKRGVRRAAVDCRTQWFVLPETKT